MINYVLSLTLHNSWRKFAVRKSASSKSEKILDACSGTADFAIEYANVINRGRIICSDFCYEILRKGRAKIKANSLSKKTDLVIADTLQLPFKENYFDIVSIGFGLRNLDNMSNGLSEMNRVLKENGKIVILEFSKPKLKVLKSLHRLYLKFILPFIGDLISKNRQNIYSYLGNSVLEYPDVSEIKKLIENAGFINIRIYPKTFGIVSIYIGEKK